MYVQITDLYSDVTEVAIRGDAIECNKSSGKYKAVRVAGKRWVIYSKEDSDNKNLEDIIEKAKRVAGKGGIELADAELAKGEYKFKRGHFSEDEAIEVLIDLKRNLNGFVEAVITYERSVREIVTNDGCEAREEKETLDLNISVARRSTASLHIGGIGGLEILEDSFDFIVQELNARINGLRRAGYLNPLMKGHYNVVLTKESACAFVHELVHKLEADIGGNLDEGEHLTVYDDPTGFGGYHFDDEGVLAERKCLIEDGKIIDYLHTRETAYKYSDVPRGNGRGIFTIPKAFQTNLVVSRGDWTFDEMVEEIREGFVAEGLIRAEIRERTINIYPELCWYVKSEIICPVTVNVIKIPIKNALKLVEGVGREYFERVSYEKGFPISEISPPILINAFVG